jgi:hypothetical protein
VGFYRQAPQHLYRWLRLYGLIIVGTRQRKLEEGKCKKDGES